MIKKLIVSSVLFSCISIANGEFFSIQEIEQKQTQKLTLHQCLVMALKNNVGISISENNPLIARWTVYTEKSIFDPDYIFSVQHGDSKQPLPSITRLSTGLSAIETETLNFKSGLTGLVPFGTRYELLYEDSKAEGTTTFFESEYQGSLGFNITQPLLKNLGVPVNTAHIRISRIDKNISIEELRRVVIDTLVEVQNRYWDLVLARKDLAVLQERLDLAKTLLKDNTKKVDVGILPPIEITTAKAAVASREEAVIVGEQTILDRENELKVLIYSDSQSIIKNTIVPTDDPNLTEPELSFQKSLTLAFANRPEYLIAKKRVEAQNINAQFYRNQELPDVNFVGEYSFNGLNGNYGNALDKTFSEETRDWFVGVEVDIPLGNRLQRSKYQTARLEAKKQALELKRIELELVKQVDNAIAQIKTNLKRVNATVAATILGQEALDAENRRFESGASTSLDVLQVQNNLSLNKIQETKATIDLMKSLFELSRVEGDLLSELSIDFEGYYEKLEADSTK